MDQAEQVAKSVIEAVIQGAEMRYCQDQSAGQRDFDLVHQSGAVDAVEVATAADEPRERTVAAIMHPRKGGPFIRTQRWQKKWLIRPLPSANINPIRAEVDAYLAEAALSARIIFRALLGEGQSLRGRHALPCVCRRHLRAGRFR